MRCDRDHDVCVEEVRPAGVAEAGAARGRLAVELSTSGLRYEAETADDTAAAMAELQEQFDELVQIVGALSEQLDARVAAAGERRLRQEAMRVNATRGRP